MTGLGDDLGGALRRLRASPGTTASAVIALAVGIGFCAAVYSVAGGLLFRPVPVEEIDRVVLVGMRRQSEPDEFRKAPPADVEAWRKGSKSLESVAAMRVYEASLTSGGEVQALTGARVTASYFEVMRIRPALGRWFEREEERPGEDRSLVLNYRLWERLFAADPQVVGREVDIDGRKMKIAGVLPKGFNYPRGADFLTPLALDAKGWADGGSFYLQAAGRLQSGVTLKQAESELAGLSRQVAPGLSPLRSEVTPWVVGLRERASGQHAPRYTRLMIASVLFMLLIACLNVANLQLAQVLGRARETAVRAALGASWWRIVRRSLVESLVLAACGTALGLLISVWCVDLMRAAMPPEVERSLPGWQSVGIDGWVLFWTAVTAAAAGVAAGAGPAVWLARVDPGPMLAGAGRTTPARGRRRARAALVVCETSMALVLLIGAGLMVKSFRAIGELGLALDPREALTMRLSLAAARYGTPAAVARFEQRLVEELSSLAGVESAAVVSNLPQSGGANFSPVRIVGEVERAGAPPALAQVQAVSPGYFRTIGLALEQGRDFALGDADGSPAVAVVSESFARRHFAGGPALGRRIELGGGAPLTVTGVVADVMHDFTDRAVNPTLYRPVAQQTWNVFDVVVRTRGAGELMAGPAREAVRRIDSQQPVYMVRSYRKLIDDNRFGIGYVATTLAALGVAALLLSMLGVYSVMAHLVAEQRREFGVRLALGARRADVVRLVAVRGMRMAVPALALGLGAGWAVSRMLASALFAVSPNDLAVMAGSVAALAAALVAATIGPARRAARLDPIEALRYE